MKKPRPLVRVGAVLLERLGESPLAGRDLDPELIIHFVGEQAEALRTRRVAAVATPREVRESESEDRFELLVHGASVADDRDFPVILIGSDDCFFRRHEPKVSDDELSRSDRGISHGDLQSGGARVGRTLVLNESGRLIKTGKEWIVKINRSLVRCQ